MNNPMRDQDIELFSTCPSSSNADRKSYLARSIDVACWSERVGCRGILVCADNSQVDPWLMAHIIIQHTELLCPLVAVQPIYMHPYSVAKIVASMAHLYGRRVYLNMVARGFKNDVITLNDSTPHDQHYDRLVEYTLIVKRLLAGGAPVSFEGKFYKVEKLKLTPSLPSGLFPGIFVSGSSEAGLAAAEAMGATAIRYPKPLKESRGDRPSSTLASGIRVGIVSRPRGEDAWAAALAQFPEDRKGPLTRHPATKVSDSVWHKPLPQVQQSAERTPYWLVPFEQYQTMCPYLVGDYDLVGQEVAGYISLGYRTFILDVPRSVEELGHIRQVFDRAEETSTWQTCSTTG